MLFEPESLLGESKEEILVRRVEAVPARQDDWAKLFPLFGGGVDREFGDDPWRVSAAEHASGEVGEHVWEQFPAPERRRLQEQALSVRDAMRKQIPVRLDQTDGAPETPPQGRLGEQPLDGEFGQEPLQLTWVFFDQFEPGRA
jgi:hypothetical protein